MFVKLCGTTSLEDAQLAVNEGADALGFIFAPSKRRVTVEEAAAIIAQVPPSVETVAVFTDADAATILDTAEAINATTVQIHRPYDARFLDAFDDDTLKLWQVISFEIDPEQAGDSEQRFLEELRSAFEDDRLSAILLDTSRAGVSGGTGQSFDWQRARSLVDEALGQFGFEPRAKIILAGGLHAGNVGVAIEQMRPWGVDVVSGTEAAPGRKDPHRVKAFMKAVRETGS